MAAASWRRSMAAWLIENKPMAMKYTSLQWLASSAEERRGGLSWRLQLSAGAGRRLCS